MKQHTRYHGFFSLLLVMFLLAGQFAVIVHAEEHPFHDAQHSCEIFLAAEQADGVAAIVADSVPLSRAIGPDIRLAFPSLSILSNAYQARAPPFLS